MGNKRRRRKAGTEHPALRAQDRKLATGPGETGSALAGKQPVAPTVRASARDTAPVMPAQSQRWFNKRRAALVVVIVLAGGWAVGRFVTRPPSIPEDLPLAFRVAFEDEQYFAEPVVDVAQTAATPLADRLGRRIGDFSLVDQGGEEVSLGALDAEIVVAVFLSCDCPLAQRYMPVLVDLVERYRERGVAWLAIVPGERDTDEAVDEFAETYGVNFPILRDRTLEVSRQFSAERTPEAYVLDREHCVRYAGRIDDQFGLHQGMKYQRTESRREDVCEAVEELLAGEEVSVPLTPTAGCLIHYPKVDPTPATEVTWSNRIAHIFQERCQGCHRPGQIGPFPLLTYADTAGWESAIAEVVAERRMPPWHADPRFGDFANDPSLSADEITAIETWVERGAPEGDRAELPAPRRWPSGGNILDPDRIIYIADEPLVVPANGAPEFKYFFVDLGLKEGVWVSQVECRPDNLAIVHHMDLLVAAAGDFDEAYRRGQVARISGYVPGIQLNDPAAGGATSNAPMYFVPAGSQIMIELHYRPSGRDELDRSSVAFRFARTADGKLMGATGEGIDPVGIVDAELARRQQEVSANSAPAEPMPTMAQKAKEIEFPPGYEYRESEILSSDLRGRETASVLIENYDICVPPRESNYRVEAWYTFLYDSLLGSMHVHIHTRGKAMRYVAHYPNGLKEVLLNVPQYDYEWQHVYVLERMKWMPRGTRIEVVTHFDNSAENLRNPDPEATLVYGRGYYDEEMTAATITFLPLTGDDRSVTLDQLRDGWDVARNVDAAEALATYTPVGYVPMEHRAAYYHQRAQYRQQIGDLMGAMEDFHVSIGIDARRLEAYLDRGQLYDQMGERQRAAADFSHVVQSEPRRAEAHFLLGLVRESPEEAIANLERALSLDPRHHEALYYRGVMRERSGDVQGAVNDYTAIIRGVHPGYTLAYLRRGSLLIANGQESLGREDFETVMRRWPAQRTKVDYTMGVLRFDLQQFAEAIPYLEAAARISPDDVRIRRSLGIALFEVGDPRATDHLSAAIELDASDVAARMALAGAFEREGKATLALSHYREALRLAPEHPMVLNNLAWLLSTQAERQPGQVEEAVQLARRACELTEDQEPGCLDTLAVALAAGQHWREAIEAARRAVERFLECDQSELAARASERLRKYEAALADVSSEAAWAR